jgi:hypothetical protein
MAYSGRAIVIPRAIEFRVNLIIYFGILEIIKKNKIGAKKIKMAEKIKMAAKHKFP